MYVEDLPEPNRASKECHDGKVCANDSRPECITSIRPTVLSSVNSVERGTTVNRSLIYPDFTYFKGEHKAESFLRMTALYFASNYPVT